MIRQLSLALAGCVLAGCANLAFVSSAQADDDDRYWRQYRRDNGLHRGWYKQQRKWQKRAAKRAARQFYGRPGVLYDRYTLYNPAFNRYIYSY